MDAMTTGEVARALHTSIPRVRRALARSGLSVTTTDGGHTLVPTGHVRQLARQLGVVPAVPGLTREEVQVLGALNLRPLGVSSARVAAQAAGVSPTVASSALKKLLAEGYVTHDLEKLIEGRVVERPVWRIKRSGQPWQLVADLVRQVVLPTRKVDVGRAQMRLPRRLAHLFWNADVSKIDLQRDPGYVAGRILSSNDTQALAWMAGSLPPEAVIEASLARGISEQDRALAKNLVSQ